MQIWKYRNGILVLLKNAEPSFIGGRLNVNVNYEELDV